MHKKLLSLLIFFRFSADIFATTYYVAGEVSGNWPVGNIFVVTGDIVIPEGEMLTIDEGVMVRFNAGTGMVCNGSLIANGTDEAPVYFYIQQSDSKLRGVDSLQVQGKDSPKVQRGGFSPSCCSRGPPLPSSGGWIHSVGGFWVLDSEYVLF